MSARVRERVRVVGHPIQMRWAIEAVVLDHVTKGFWVDRIIVMTVFAHL
jgi:hypothetical protein